MELINVLHKSKEEKPSGGFGMNFDFFKGEGASLPTGDLAEDPVSAARKRGRPKKKQVGNETIIGTETGELNELQSNKPYSESYDDSTVMLKNSIGQIDSLSNDINAELQAIRASKTLRSKYKYITDLAGTSSSLIGTKIAAIREINSTITNCHNLEMKRMKELNVGGNQDEDKTIMDYYNAFVNTPVGANAPILGPSVADLTTMNPNIIHTDIAYTGDPGYNNYVANMTPEQNRMRLEKNPNIQTCVVYDSASGDRHFEIIDSTNGMPVPNMPVPGEFLLRDMTIDTRTGVARNAQADMNFPLIVVGQGNLNEY